VADTQIAPADLGLVAQPDDLEKISRHIALSGWAPTVRSRRN
jgi:hypothetical protein